MFLEKQLKVYLHLHFDSIKRPHQQQQQQRQAKLV